MSDPLARFAELAGAQDGWLVGGAVRDRALHRPTADYDVVVRGDPRGLAQALARAAGGHPFKLSEAFAVWRVVAHDRSWQLDLLPLTAPSIEADLAARDFTINAIAEPVGQPANYIDPFGGLADLQARRLRMVSDDTFRHDALRALRLARLACELDFKIDAATAASARSSAPALADIAPERIFAELKRLISSDRALLGLDLMDQLTITEAVLPELSHLRGIEQSRYHHLDVHEHTRAVLAQTIELERDPEPLGPYQAAVAELLSTPLANELTRWHALRFGALFHDIAKPQTRQVTAQGRITFMGHDAAGAEIAREALTRLRASDRLGEHVAALARHHLRLGFLVHEVPLSRRAIYRYLRACEPVQVDVTVLSVADRLATRGSGSHEAIARHLELAGQLLGEALRWIEDPPRPPLRGDDVARALGVAPGPEIGRILAELEEASFAGEIDSRHEAIQRARELLHR